MPPRETTMPPQDRPKFVRGPNTDRTVDSIRTKCLATVASSDSEVVLDRSEKARVRDPAYIERWKNLSEGRVKRPR